LASLHTSRTAKKINRGEDVGVLKTHTHTNITQIHIPFPHAYTTPHLQTHTHTHTLTLTLLSLSLFRSLSFTHIPHGESDFLYPRLVILERIAT
jgi:hypothetical protein